MKSLAAISEHQVSIRIKQVPNASPDADGEWIVTSVPTSFLDYDNRSKPSIWAALTKHCDANHHAVQYEFTVRFEKDK